MLLPASGQGKQIDNHEANAANCVIISLALMPGRGGFGLLGDAIGGLGRRLRRIAGFGNAVFA